MMKMKKLYVIAFVMLICCLPCYSQIHIIDESDNSAVAYAQLVSDSGAFIGSTDSLGRYAGDVPQSFSVQHVGYATKRFMRADIKDGRIYLCPANIQMDNVTVTAKKKEYIRLKGYFRAFQLCDSILKYYTDGIGEYYVSLKKRAVELNVLGSRYLKNDSLMQLDRKSLNKSDYTISYPVLDGVTLFGKSGKENHIMVRTDSVHSTKRVEADWLAGKGQKSHTLFGYTSTLVNSYTTEVYRMQPDFQSFMDLMYRKDYRRLYYKHKKDEKPKMLDLVYEIYVTEAEYVSKDQVKGLKKENLNVSSEDIPLFRDNYHIPKLSHVMETMISKMGRF